ncbi:hypothetical protein ACHAXT_009379 [Thalassiosira profunda]
MRFRPLCIDYHARAQEIAALERDARARRAALAVLPLPHPSPTRNRTQANSPRCRGDGGARDGGDGHLERREDKENWDGGNAAGNDVGEGGQGLKGDAADSEPAMEGPVEASKENGGPETSLGRLQSIAAMLGPAVHPSECAFRSIARVTEGPVRGRKLPVARVVANPLEEWTKSGENYAEARRNAAIAALESGRSRFDPRGVDSFLSILSNDCIPIGGIALDGSQDTAFADTMAVVYARLDNGDGSGGSGTNADVDADADKENDLKFLIWSQHVASLPMPKSLYLRHEPEDIAKIYRLQAARSAAMNSSFACEAIQAFRPQLRALEEQREPPGVVTRKGLALVASAGDVSSKPRIDLLSRCNQEPRKQQDYALRLSRVPFTQFLDDRHDVDAGEGVEMAPPFRALEFEDNARFAIRLDPDIDPLHPASLEEKERKPLRELLKPLDEMCSARSISARLGFPGRFEASHELTDGRSRRNLQSRYSYRGLLTNEVVDSDVFQRRYSSMVAVNKLHIRPGNPETPAGTCNDPSFAQMALARELEAEKQSYLAELAASGKRKAPSEVGSNTPIREAETKTSSDAPLTLLTSESFLETYGEIVSELASGRWQKALSESERHVVEGLSNGIVVCDTPLLDIAGADIELADNSAIVVQCLSSWSEDSQNGGSAMSMQQGARAFLRRLVSLAASGRYEAIHVILCLDVEISSVLPGEISNLQNAVLQQSGCPCDHARERGFWGPSVELGLDSS